MDLATEKLVMWNAFLVDIFTVFTNKMRQTLEVCQKIKKEPLKKATKHDACIPHLNAKHWFYKVARTEVPEKKIRRQLKF